MKEQLREVTDKELKEIVLKETIFPTQLKDLKNIIHSQGVDTQLFSGVWLNLTNRGELTETPGYYVQAAEPHPHQLALPDFDAENRHDTAAKGLVEFLRSIPDPRPCH